MANIKITIDGALMDGHKVTFKAPCDCTSVEKLKVLYVKDGAQVSKLFTMKDAHGNTLTGLGNLFEAGAYVHAILDTVNGYAYIQNPDTNGYLEGKFAELFSHLGEIRYASFIDDANSGDHMALLKANWENLEVARTYIVRLNSGYQRVAIVQKYATHAWGSVLIFGYGQGQLVYHELKDGVWDYWGIADKKDLENYIPLTDNNAVLKRGGMISPYGDIYHAPTGKWFSTLIDEKLDKTGGWLSDCLSIQKGANTDVYYRVKGGAEELYLYLSGGGQKGLYDANLANWIIVENKDGTVDIPHVTSISALKVGGNKALTSADFVVTGSASEATLTINLD
jgi:hypothetical protein